MSQNQQPPSNVGSVHSTDNNRNIVEGMWKLNIQDSSPASTYPDRPGEPDCLYYLRTGVCGYGSNCRFNHPVKGALFSGELPERTGQPDCGFYLKTGACKYGSTCKYHHPRDRRGATPVSFNILGLPMRQDEKPCPYYMRTTSCKFGVACKFHHPHPASSGTALPVTRSSFYGSVASNVIPSPGLHFPGSLPAWSLPHMPFPVGPHVQGPQSYAPVVISPSQGWNTYSVPSLNQDFPERPEQPECRHFMRTGTCKYGSDCKYNHSNERIVQAAKNDLGYQNQAIYSNYRLYGTGETGNYDQHLAAYPYHYGLSMPALPIVDTSLVYHQRNMLSDDSSKSSKSSNYVKLPKSTETGKELDTDKMVSNISTGKLGLPETSPPSSETSHVRPG